MGFENPHHETVSASQRFESELTVDAERALSPTEVRSIILAQHERIRELLHAIDDKAIRLLACPVPNAREREQMRALALELCSVMTSHIALENRILVRALACVDAWGLVRAELLRQEHSEQLLLLQVYTQELEVESATGTSLALTANSLVSMINADMEHEEATVLQASLLSDDAGARSDVETG